MSPAPDEIEILDHARFLRRLVRGVVADEDVAGDLVQETWLAERTRPPPASFNLAGWLVRVARRLAGRINRSEQRRVARERSVARPERLAATVDLVSREETLRIVTDAVLALDAPDRSLVMQRYYEDLTPEQIAQRCGAPVATIRSRLQRARERLRARLESRLRTDLREALGWFGGIPAVAGAGAGAGVATGAATGAGAAVLGALAVTSSAKVVAAIGVVVAAGAVWWIGANGSLRGRARSGETVRSTDAVASKSADAPRTTPAAGDAERTPATLPRPDEAAGATAPIDARHASLLLHVVWEKDGSPAPGRSVAVLQWQSPPARRMFARKSDAAARVQLDALEPGKVYLEADLGGELAVDLQPGERVEKTLAIPPGYLLHGRVVDLDHQPVAGASIWCSSYFNYTSGCIVVAADAEGRFEIPAVPEARYVAAMKAGYAPSALTYVEELHHRLQNARKHAEAVADAATAAAADVVELELVLLGEGSALRGVVLDPDGKPAVGAAIDVVGQVPALPKPAPDLGTGMVAIAPYATTSDVNGRFEIEGLPVGPAAIHVLSAGCAPHDQAVTLIAKETADVVVRLAREGVVTGKVTTPKGDPVEAADVHLDVEYDPLRPSAKTDSKGDYVLSGMTIGQVRIAATSEKFGKGRASLRVLPGVAARCDLVVDAGLVLSGQVVDEKGQPVGGLCIDANHPMKQFWGQAKTDDEGRFRILNCPDAPLMVDVKQECTDWQPLLAVADVHAGGEELHLTLGAAASIHVVVVAPDGGPASVQLTPWLQGQSYSHNHESDPKTGVIDVHGLAPGTYSLSLSGDDTATLRLGTHVLKGGDHLDLGTIVLKRPGRMKVKRDEAFAAFDLGLRVFARARDDDPLDAMITSIDVVEAQAGIALAPGRYLLCAHGSGAALCSRRFEVFAGQETTVDLAVEPGVACSASIDLPKELTTFEWIEGWVEGDDLLASLPIGGRANGTGAILVGTFRLLPGRYRLFVTIDRKWTGRADLEVAEGATPRATIQVR